MNIFKMIARRAEADKNARADKDKAVNQSSENVPSKVIPDESVSEISEEAQEEVREEVEIDIVDKQEAETTVPEKINIREYLMKIEGKVDELERRSNEGVSAEIAELRGLVEDLDARLTAARNDIFFRIHDEDVKCYRNIKGLVDELGAKVKEQKEESERIAEEKLGEVRKSFKGMKIMIAVILILAAMLIVLHLDIPQLENMLPFLK